MRGALLVAGTHSDAGKSVVTAGIIRWLARQGVRVAPFKAQNMSLNSGVTPDGAEIGRAQVMQAAAAGIEPDARMNPVLLKPGGERHSQVVVLGRPLTEVDALTYRRHAPRLRQVALDALAGLRAEYDVVICEGAGSPAEINLRDTDIANMGLARAAGLPVVVVGDIDRGGVFASLFGTLALLEPADQALIAGFVINKFRGDPRLLAPGVERFVKLTGRQSLGVLPWRDGLWLDVEDSLALDARRGGGAASDDIDPVSAPSGGQSLRVAVVRLPRISNFTDVDALEAEPGVVVRFVTGPDDLDDADLVVVPGSRATVADLRWLRQRGLVEPIMRRAAAGRPLLGICGGYQMFAARIEDEVESGEGLVEGLGLLPVTVRFGRDKVLGRPHGRWLGQRVTGYEIRHGVPRVDGGEEFPGGVRVGRVYGTSWHGVFENDGFRRAFLAEVASVTGRRFVPAPGVDFAAIRQRRLDALGDLIADHLDTDALSRVIEGGAPTGLPCLTVGGAVGSRVPDQGAPAVPRSVRES